MMTTMIKYICIALALFTPCTVLFAQHSDGGVWLYTGVKGEIIKDLSWDAGEELRYNVSVADLYQYNTHASISYKFTKKIKVNGEYRYSVRESGNTHRYGFGVAYREGFGKLDIGLRSKYQYSTAPDGSEGTAWRNKMTVFYEINKDLEWYGSGELFYTLSNEGNQFDNVRAETGVDYKLTKRSDLTLSYIYDREFMVNSPGIMHILNIGYVYGF